MRCRHCRNKATRPRGLCATCYYKPAIRKLYVTGGTFNRGRRMPGDPRRVRAARFATCAEPGSEAKLLVLERRRERGQELEHPHDAGSMDLQGLAELVRRVLNLPALSPLEARRRAIDALPMAA